MTGGSLGGLKGLSYAATAMPARNYDKGADYVQTQHPQARQPHHRVCAPRRLTPDIDGRRSQAHPSPGGHLTQQGDALSTQLFRTESGIELELPQHTPHGPLNFSR